MEFSNTLGFAIEAPNSEEALAIRATVIDVLSFIGYDVTSASTIPRGASVANSDDAEYLELLRESATYGQIIARVNTLTKEMGLC